MLRLFSLFAKPFAEFIYALTVIILLKASEYRLDANFCSGFAWRKRNQRQQGGSLAISGK